MDIHFKKLLLPILALFAMTAHAQSLSGLVTDEETGQPLEAVMISVLRNGTMIDYALTDARGRYSLPWKYNGNLQVSVSLLGYRREIRNISAAGTLHIRLHPEAIALKEVQIRPGRIHGRKDTVRYNLAEFASSKDIHIKDVLKKLPGVDIDDNGQVKYKGKAIDHYFVEGMDVTGGRYSQINNNLSAKAVKSAEIMENYQSVKALKGKLSSDEIALNLKLDPQARDQWIVNGTLGAGRVSITSRRLWYFLASSRFASMVLRVSIEISDIKKLPPFQWQLSFLLFRERKHAPCAFTHSRVCTKQKRRLPSYKIIGEKDCCYCQQVP